MGILRELVRWRLHESAVRWFRSVTESRPPDFIIGGAENPYLLRWWLIPRRFAYLGNVYFHKFKRSDDDRALHDHPWWSLSYMVRGSVIEHLPGGAKRLITEGQFIFRRGKDAHRIELHEGWLGPREAWTVFIVGPRFREWGFHCPNGWVHWKKFCLPSDSGTIGKGCDQ